MKVLVTGAAGFIGYHLCKKLISNGFSVIGIDNLNDYYDVKLKKNRINEINTCEYAYNFEFNKIDIADKGSLLELFKGNNINFIINLAAQPGVRYSLINPEAYIYSNIVGFANMLECCRNSDVEHFIYASSSSVYGLNKTLPYSCHHDVSHPVSLYAATKKSDEMIAHAYSHLFGIPCTGLRFFTVYGPWGRPDMSPYLFTSAIIQHRPIKLFNHGNMKRDFTYIDDIVDGVFKIISQKPVPNASYDLLSPDPAGSSAPWAIYNIGNNTPVPLKHFINTLENIIGIKADIELLPMQAGDVEATWADIDDLEALVGFQPSTSLEEGLQKYVSWYLEYYR